MAHAICSSLGLCLYCLVYSATRFGRRLWHRPARTEQRLLRTVPIQSILPVQLWMSQHHRWLHDVSHWNSSGLESVNMLIRDMHTMSSRQLLPRKWTECELPDWHIQQRLWSHQHLRLSVLRTRRLQFDQRLNSLHAVSAWFIPRQTSY